MNNNKILNWSNIIFLSEYVKKNKMNKIKK